MTGSLIALILAADVIVGWLLADAGGQKGRPGHRPAGHVCAAAPCPHGVVAGLSPAFMTAGRDSGGVGRLDAVEVQMQAAGGFAPGCGGPGQVNSESGGED